MHANRLSCGCMPPVRRCRRQWCNAVHHWAPPCSTPSSHMHAMYAMPLPWVLLRAPRAPAGTCASFSIPSLVAEVPGPLAAPPGCWRPASCAWSSLSAACVRVRVCVCVCSRNRVLLLGAHTQRTSGVHKSARDEEIRVPEMGGDGGIPLQIHAHNVCQGKGTKGQGQ
eukprot:1147661-Pelagomonas_calceolata.AAC.5